MSELEKTKQWFEQAIPNPTVEQTCIQVGCHYEEVSEMMEAMHDYDCGLLVEELANDYKRCELSQAHHITTMGETDRIALLDALADQIVTATGVAHMFGMDILGALAEVNRSNFSKFEDGEPVFNDQGKITKGKHYSKPNLKPFIGG